MLPDYDFGLDEGDWILYLPTKQVGMITAINAEYEILKFEVKIQNPDKRIICQKENLKLICPNG